MDMDERDIIRMIDRAIAGIKIRAEVDIDMDIKITLYDCVGNVIDTAYIYKSDIEDIVNRM